MSEKMEFTLPIYGVAKSALSLNWYRNAHYRENNKAKKVFQQLVKSQLKVVGKVEGPISVEYRYYAKRRGTDLDNFTSVAKKFFQDSLVNLGVIEDDTCEFIISNSEVYMGIDKGNPRVEAVITIL